MGAGRWTGWISTGWWYSGPTDTIRRKDERKTPEMNVSDRVHVSKKELAKNIIRASSTMRLNMVTRYGFGSKIMKFHNFEPKSTKNKGNH